MRRDIPEDLQKRGEQLPSDLRQAWQEFVDIAYPTEDEREEAAREREKAEWRREATRACDLATLVARALDGEWGDDVRRAVDELVRDVKPEVALLAEWGKRATSGDRLTEVEFAAARNAVTSTRVRYALAAAEKLARDADRERRQPGRRR